MTHCGKKQQDLKAAATWSQNQRCGFELRRQSLRVATGPTCGALARGGKRGRKLFLKNCQLMVEPDAHANAAVENGRHRLAYEHIAGQQILHDFQCKRTISAAIDGNKIGG